MGPGEYTADPTEGITRVEDLPLPLVHCRSRNYRRRRCPHCGHAAYRNGLGSRTLHDLSTLQTGRPLDLSVRYSKHRCPACRPLLQCRSVRPGPAREPLHPPGHLGGRPFGGRGRLALPHRLAGTSGATTASLSPTPPSRTGSRRRGKKADARAETDLPGLGPGRLLRLPGRSTRCTTAPSACSRAVDGPRQHRLLYEVLDHDPDPRRHPPLSLRDSRQQLAARGGYRPRASPPMARPCTRGRWPSVSMACPHQVCEFHILKELTKAVLRVVARIAQTPVRRDPEVASRAAPKDPAAQRKAPVGPSRSSSGSRSLFEHRHLFVRHHLRRCTTARLQRLCRGQPAIAGGPCRSWTRCIVCSTAAAERTRPWRSWPSYVSGCGATAAWAGVLDKLNSPNLEKALTFLDDKLLPATSNAVERGNRRVRKMQKTVYRVRTQAVAQRPTGIGPPERSASRQSPSNLGGPAQGPRRAGITHLPCYSRTPSLFLPPAQT